MTRPTYADLYRAAIKRDPLFAIKFIEKAISLSKNSHRPMKLTAEQMLDAEESLALLCTHPGERYRDATQEDFDRWGISESITGVPA